MELMTSIEKLIEQQNAILSQIADSFSGVPKQTLGFCESPRRAGTVYVFANRSQGGLWYTLNSDGKPELIEQPALAGYITKLEFKQVERRGKEVWKTHLHVRVERQTFIVEFGSDTETNKGVISALSQMTPAQLQSVCTLEVQAADQSDEVLFASVYSNNELVFAPYNKDSNWRDLAKKAIANVEAAHPSNVDN